MSGLTAQVRNPEGWPVPGALLTVTDLQGRQLARAQADDGGVVTTEALPAGMHTAVVTAPGYQPMAQVARVSASGAGQLGDVRLQPEADSVGTPPAGPWTIDPMHSEVIAVSRHLGIASINARFAEISGRLDVAEVFEQTKGFAEIKAASIDTGIQMRDDHLRSAEFLDVETYPLITFTGSGFKRIAGDRWVMAGELQLHGQHRPVELDVTYGGHGPDPWGGVRAAFRAETQLHRSDFAIDYNAMVRAGVAAIGTTVKIEMNLELVQGESLPQF
ncbi:MAG: YceI family protein [Nocardia sp.]|nr:YceI family protein [Nocardia sp.]